MHPEIDLFINKVKSLYPDFFTNKKVLEVGSQDINGSIRHNFMDCGYIGIDLGEAPGVDIVSDIVDYKHPKEFDVVISCEALEHAPEWERFLLQMFDNLKPGGIFILTCASVNRQEHGTRRTTPQDSQFTLDHYRNISMADFTNVLPLRLFKKCSLSLERDECDLYFWGIKK